MEIRRRGGGGKVDGEGRASAEEEESLSSGMPKETNENYPFPDKSLL